ncbi:MAG: hypothetical protein Q8O75_03525 [bacterium]|nr:hypothetical protein [bacterium]
MDPAPRRRKLLKAFLSLFLLVVVTVATYGFLYFLNAEEIARRNQPAKAAICPNSKTFTEDFSTTTYRDSVTTAWWNNSNAPGYLQLPWIRRNYENVRHSTVVADGKFYATYFNLFGAYSINLQIVDSSPLKQFYDDKRVSQIPSGNQTQLYSTLARDNSSGDLYFVWEDFRDPNTAFDFYAVRTDKDGNRLWTNDVKVNLTSFPSNTSGGFKASDVEVDNNGDIYFAFHDNNSTNLFLQKLDKNGNHLWASDVAIVGVPQLQAFTIKVGESGDLYVVYGLGSASDQLRIRKYSPTGSLIWERNVASSLVSGDRGEIGTAINSAETVYIAYARFGDGIYYTTVDKDGNVGTATKIAPYYDAPSAANGPNADLSFAADFQSAYIVTSNSTDRTAAYKYDLSGNKLWGPVQLSTMDTAAFPNPVGAVDSSGNFYPYYPDNFTGASVGFLSAQKVSSSGSLIWNPDVLVDRLAFFQTPRLGQSTRVAQESWDIKQATLTADVIHNYKEDQYIQDFTGQTSIKWYLSNDDGVTWEEVTLGVAHNFTSTGSALKWRAGSLETNNTIVSPRVDELTIEYGDCTSSLPPPENPPENPPSSPPSNPPSNPPSQPPSSTPNLPNTGTEAGYWILIAILPIGIIVRLYANSGLRRIINLEIYEKHLMRLRRRLDRKRKNRRYFSSPF